MVGNTLRFQSDPTPKLIILAFQGSVPRQIWIQFPPWRKSSTKNNNEKKNHYSFCHILFQINHNLITLLLCSTILHMAISFYSCGKRTFYLESYNGGGCQSSGDRNIISTKVTRKDSQIISITRCGKLKFSVQSFTHCSIFA